MEYRSGLWIFIFSAAIIALLMTVTWQRRRLASGRAFLFLMACALVWTVNFILEIASQSLTLKELFVQFQYTAIAFLPLTWLYLSLSYTGHIKSRKYWLLLSAVPVMTSILIWLVPQPNWFWKEPRFVLSSAQFAVMDYDYGFWFYCVHLPYTFFLIFAALFVLMRPLFKSHSIYRRQIMMIIIAILLPVLTNILYIFGCSPIKSFNFTTAVFSISCLIIAWALFRHQFLDLLPMARDLVIENMDDGVIVLDMKNRIVDVNPAGMAISGISKSDIGRPLWELCPGLISDTFEEISFLDKKQMEARTGEGDNRHVFDIRISRIKDQIGQLLGSVVTLRDDTERSNLFKQLHEQAIRDSLTGIFNRRHFMELGQGELNRVKRNPDTSMSVIMLDIDNFKTINDQYGHAAGDKVLVAFTEQCRKSIRPYDIFGRLGGDEFALILPDTSPEDGLMAAGRVRKNIEKMRVSTAAKSEISITVSMGVISSQGITEAELDLERLLHLSDQAMYDSKNKGRD